MQRLSKGIWVNNESFRLINNICDQNTNDITIRNNVEQTIFKKPKRKSLPIFNDNLNERINSKNIDLSFPSIRDCQTPGMEHIESLLKVKKSTPIIKKEEMRSHSSASLRNPLPRLSLSLVRKKNHDIVNNNIRNNRLSIVNDCAISQWNILTPHDNQLLDITSKITKIKIEDENFEKIKLKNKYPNRKSIELKKIEPIYNENKKKKKCKSNKNNLKTRKSFIFESNENINDQYQVPNTLEILSVTPIRLSN